VPQRPSVPGADPGDARIVVARCGPDACRDIRTRRPSQQRADEVKECVFSKGIDAKRIYTEGKGPSQPVADNRTAEGRAKNRRVEIEVVGTRTIKR
jgi:OOP family OmpA-OmpF porin